MTSTSATGATVVDASSSNVYVKLSHASLAFRCTQPQRSSPASTGCSKKSTTLDSMVRFSCRAPASGLNSTKNARYCTAVVSHASVNPCFTNISRLHARLSWMSTMLSTVMGCSGVMTHKSSGRSSSSGRKPCDSSAALVVDFRALYWCSVRSQPVCPDDCAAVTAAMHCAAAFASSSFALTFSSFLVLKSRAAGSAPDSSFTRSPSLRKWNVGIDVMP